LTGEYTESGGEKALSYHLNNKKTLSHSDCINIINNYTYDVISIWNHDGNLAFVSNSLKQVFGYKLSDIQMKSWRYFLPRSDVKLILDEYKDKHEHQQQFELQIRHSKGHYVWCEIRIIKCFNHEKECPYFIGIVRDITERKEVDRLMTHSEKMAIAGQLAAGIVHEIRNPLTSLKGFLQLIQSGIAQKDIYFDILIDEIEKIEVITSELLYISKPTTNRVQCESVNSMLFEVIELLKPQANLKHISLEMHIDNEEHLIIKCDRSQIKQVFINLIKNAIEAMDAKGLIQIIAKRQDEHIIIDVVDEGIGISQDHIDHLGEAFFTTKDTGTGLGLVITKQILERHKAKLQVFQNKEKGSTFRIVF